MVQSKVSLAKNFHIAPSEVSQMAYWEFEMMVEEAIRQNEEEKSKQDEQEGKYNPDSYVNHSMGMMRQSQFKPPTIPKPSMPNMSKFKV